MMDAETRDAADILREQGADRLREQVDQDINDQRKAERAKQTNSGGAERSAAQKLLDKAKSLKMLEHMTFDPIKAVVPEILIEGLTLFAGKPKAGKILAHARRFDRGGERRLYARRAALHPRRRALLCA